MTYIVCQSVQPSREQVGYSVVSLKDVRGYSHHLRAPDAAVRQGMGKRWLTATVMRRDPEHGLLYVGFSPDVEPSPGYGIWVYVKDVIEGDRIEQGTEESL